MGSNKYIITEMKCWPVFKQDPICPRNIAIASEGNDPTNKTRNGAIRSSNEIHAINWSTVYAIYVTSSLQRVKKIAHLYPLVQKFE